MNGDDHVIIEDFFFNCKSFSTMACRYLALEETIAKEWTGRRSGCGRRERQANSLLNLNYNICNEV